MNPRAAVAVAAVLACGAGCGGSTADAGPPTVNADATIVAFHNLGPLGGAAHPTARDIAVTIDGEECHPGGLVVRRVEDGGPLASAGLLPGDVIVRVGAELLPNKPDPTPDFWTAVEASISAGAPIELTWLRDGTVATAALRIDLPPLERGLPDAVERFDLGARRALAFLAGRQNADGSVGAPPRLAVTALAGCAFLASGSRLRDGDFADQLRGCYDYVTAAFAGESSATAMDLALATMFLAELTATGASPKLTGALERSTGLLLAQQVEDGGWPATGDRDAVTNQALLALGMASRAGRRVPDEAITRGCRYLQQMANDGHIGRTTRPDFDRRSEAGRCAGAAAALQALNVGRDDPYLARLRDYHVQRGTELAAAPALATLHTLNAAVACRQRGGGDWLRYYADFRHLLSGVQRRDGACQWLPRATPAASFEDQDWDTACLALILGLQREHLPVLLARHAPADLPMRDAAGAVQAADARPAGGEPPPDAHGGMRMIQLNPGEDLDKQLDGLGLPDDVLKSLKEQVEQTKKGK